MSSETVIAAENLGKCYPIYARPQDRLLQMLWRGKKQHYREFWALQGVSFSVRRGEVLGIIGANGAGKSTLLQMIAGTLTPNVGELRVDGRVSALLELGAGFNPEMTGRENVYINAAMFGLSRQETDSRYAAIRAFADIGEFIDQPVKRYSSGMYVRLAFAVSVGIEPDILIVDEALAVGDIGFQTKCLDRLEQLIGNGATILLASHDVQLIRNYCTNVLYLKAGQVQEYGDPETVIEHYFMQMRQTRGGGQSGVQWTKPLHPDGIAFGTGGGTICQAELEGPARKRGFVYKGESVQLTLTAQVHEQIINPRLVFVLRDQRGYQLYGADTLEHGLTLIPDNQGYIRACFCFPAELAPGEYSLTVKLDDYRTDHVNVVLDKQISICTFRVVANAQQREFLGAVDLKGTVSIPKSQ